MKVSRQQVAYNRKLILDRASMLFRKKGFDGVGIVDIMKSAGLTHGGFYGHFRSKDQLIAESCADALTKTRENWENEARHHPDDPLGAVVRSYLTAAHRDDPATGCVFASVGAETARRRTIVRRPFTQEVRYKSCRVRKVRHGVFKNRTAQAGDRHVSRDGWSAHFGPRS